MTTIFLNTTGTLSPVPIADLGAIEFVHPTVLFEMVGSSGQYSVAELNASLDLQAAITAGYITLEDNNGDPITDIAGYDGSAADILYDNTTTGVAATNVQAALDGVVYTTTNQSVAGVKTFTEDVPLVIDSPSTTANLEIGWFDGTSLDCHGIRRSDASGLFCLMPNSDNPQIFLGNENNTTGSAFIDVDNNRPLNLNVLDTGAGSPAIVNIGSGGLSVGSLTAGGIVQADGGGVLSAGADLDDLADVVISSPASGELLVWTGSQWENASADTSDIIIRTFQWRALINANNIGASQDMRHIAPSGWDTANIPFIVPYNCTMYAVSAGCNVNNGASHGWDVQIGTGSPPFPVVISMNTGVVSNQASLSTDFNQGDQVRIRFTAQGGTTNVTDPIVWIYLIER